MLIITKLTFVITTTISSFEIVIQFLCKTYFFFTSKNINFKVMYTDGEVLNIPFLIDL